LGFKRKARLSAIKHDKAMLTIRNFLKTVGTVTASTIVHDKVKTVRTRTVNILDKFLAHFRI
jgi:hypothetical protein